MSMFTNRPGYQGGRGKAALIVDPAEMVRRMVAASLRRLAFDRILAVGSAGDAEAVLSEGALDLALIDWQLEGRTGFDLAADIRVGRLPVRRDLPIIMMTWEAAPRRVLAAQGLKLDGLLVKPMAPAALEQKIRAVLSPPPAVAPPPGTGPKRFLGRAL